MLVRHPKKALRIVRLLREELNSWRACLVGSLRVRLSFDTQRVNMLEIGSGGPSSKPGFFGLDLNLASEYPFDLRFGLPFPDQSIDFIYGEHVLEHLLYPEIEFLLRSCHRVLKANGALSLAVPDAALFINAYIKPNSDDRKIECRYDTGLSFASPVDYVNYGFYMGGQHHHMFDKQAIVAVLRLAGFDSAESREFDPALDQPARRPQSIYALALKGKGFNLATDRHFTTGRADQQ